MDEKNTGLIPSGVEPVDNLIGGLTRGGLYLVHGEAAGKSLFSLKFLIEGLRNGENGVLVIMCSPEDAVRRFGRLGYDCLEDLYSGRLTILEYTRTSTRDTSGGTGLGSALQELEWLVGESRPTRLAFDPVTSLVRNDLGACEQQAAEFAAWTRSSGATTLAIANGNAAEIIEAFFPLVDESFLFELRDIGSRATRFLFFEKRGSIGHAVEVDPSRGIFLIDRPAGTELIDVQLARAEDSPPSLRGNLPSLETPPPSENVGSTTVDAANPLGDLLSELEGEGFVVPDIDEAVDEGSPLPQTADSTEAKDEPVRAWDQSEVPALASRRRRDEGIDSGSSWSPVTGPEVGSVVEMLLRAPAPTNVAATEGSSAKPHEAGGGARPSEFSVLVIDDEPASCAQISRALDEYTIVVVNDGITALARLISLKPDLIVLDVDLPVVDGFKILAHIRKNLDVPVIVMSGSHMRASDRVLSVELGADYYITKPFSARELRNKARQLIGRYRGINSWIMNPTNADAVAPVAPALDEVDGESRQSGETRVMLAYADFVNRVESLVRTSAESPVVFSVVGVRLPAVTPNSGWMADRLVGLVSSLVREDDVMSVNPQSEVVILLKDADATGARAFITRIEERIEEGLGREPVVWTRVFPDMARGPERRPLQSKVAGFGRRSTDKTDEDVEQTG